MSEQTSIVSILRAMALNYGKRGHSWDHLDGEAVTKAADQIDALRAEAEARLDREQIALAHAMEAASEAERLRAELEALRAENGRLRAGMAGDYDLDAWLAWVAEKEATPAPEVQAELGERHEAACGLLRDARELVTHGDFATGICCCGSAVESHGFGDGHSPVDEGDYYACQTMERIDTFLTTTPAPEVRRQEQDDGEARHDAVKAIHDVMAAVPCSSLYSLAEAVLDAGYVKAAEQGERQEAKTVCMGCVDQASRIRELEHKMDYYTTPQPAPDVSALVEALEHARMFIRNGVELGFIRMPDADTPDPAHDTLPKIEAALATYRKQADPAKFKLGDLVRKTKGSEWQGKVVGTYSTSLTPEGYAVESEAHPGSVQIYPAGALERDDDDPQETKS